QPPLGQPPPRRAPLAQEPAVDVPSAAASLTPPPASTGGALFSPATGAAPRSPSFVSVVINSPVKMVVGELGRENDRHIEIVDLKTDQSQILAKSDLRSINKDISEQTVIDSVGLPNYVAWRVKQVLPIAASGKIAQVEGAIIFAT